MPEQLLDPSQTLTALYAQQRPRLVNLCAYLTGSRHAAEDLAQETLAEAWRSRGRLADPAGAAQWLSVIARHVCLRWLRAQGRQARHLAEPPDAPVPAPDLDALPAGGPDLEIELERDELAGLLDSALALLPADTRQALLHKYLLDMPQAESAARLGLSEGAVEARLARGKLSLRRLLQTELRPEAYALGLFPTAAAGWQATRLWCPICGQHKLSGQLPGPGQDFQLHCPRCSWDPHAYFAQSNWLPDLAGTTSFRSTLRRMMASFHSHLTPGLRGATLRCQRCGRPVRLRPELPADVRAYPGFSRRGVSHVCSACGSRTLSDIYGLALDTPAGQAFWRQHPRIRTLPELPLERDGRPAWRVRLESLTATARLDVLLAQDSYEVLGAHTSYGAG